MSKPSKKQSPIPTIAPILIVVLLYFGVLLSGCTASSAFTPGLYSGIMPDPNGSMRLWNLQLMSDGTWYMLVSFEFAQPDDPPVQAPSALSRAEAGRWRLNDGLLILSASGSKDMLFKPEAGWIVSIEGQAARPDLPLDALRLTRVFP